MTGMRRSEACGLRWVDVDLENGRPSVRRAYPPRWRRHHLRTEDGARAPAVRPRRRHHRDVQGAGTAADHGPWRSRSRLDRDRLRVHARRRRALAGWVRPIRCEPNWTAL